MSHDYLSPACYHEAQAGGGPALHAACRRACTFCGAGCACPRHLESPGTTGIAVTWTDQARGIARELYLSDGLDDARYARLMDRIRTDPALFWLRGEDEP